MLDFVFKADSRSNQNSSYGPPLMHKTLTPSVPNNIGNYSVEKKMEKRTKLHFTAISAINVRAPRSNPEMSKLKNALKMHYVWSRMRRSENPISWMYRCKQIISQCRQSVIYHPNARISVAEKDGLRSCFIGLQK